jgi:hypothetical protein
LDNKEAAMRNKIALYGFYAALGAVVLFSFDSMMKKDAESQCRVHHYEWCGV